MRVFITGSRGQLGTEVERAFGGDDLFLAAHGEHDITDQKIVGTIKDFNPDIVVHTAAMTDVDGCEVAPDRAFAVNGFGTRNVAVGAEKAGAKLVYLSTDYVFDGKSEEPYDEFSPTCPINAYGRSKRAGEEFVRHLTSRFFIVRTSWLYGRVGRNFVKTILKAGAERDELRVVDDQRGNPTCARDLADVISKMVGTEAYGLYHVTGGGVCTWYEFAREIIRLASMETRIVPISSAELKRAAPRPANSSLTGLALQQLGNETPPHWKEALKEFMACREI
ncbi:MAG: dTDP-4-dehydrorhamnose reductase [Thermodesulfobacteriota bacterium]